MPNSPKAGQTTLGMPVVTCPACQETYQPAIWHHTCPPVPEALPEESANERYERLAEMFHTQTGMMAPGKDVPAAMGRDDYELRAAAWKAWWPQQHRLDARERENKELRDMDRIKEEVSCSWDSQWQRLADGLGIPEDDTREPSGVVDLALQTIASLTARAEQAERERDEWKAAAYKLGNEARAMMDAKVTNPSSRGSADHA